MGDLPCGVPGAARGEFGLFQQNRVRAPAFETPVIGKTHPHNAAADNDDAGGGWNVIGHGGVPSFRVAFSLDRLIGQQYHRQS
mgnify:CR=1 FL=1